jgi:hypothetical protein
MSSAFLNRRPRHVTRPTSRLAWLIVAMAPELLFGCGKSAAPGGADPAASGAAAASASGAAVAAPAPAPSGEAAAASSPKKIKATLADVQLFSPYSSNRTMPSASDNGSLDTTRSQFRYGLGLVVEASNEAGEILRDPTFEGVLTFSGGGNEQTCLFGSDTISSDSGTQFLSYSDKPPPDPSGFGDPAAAAKTKWFDESNSTVESPWRPSERIRMVSRRSDCRSPVLGDMGVTSIHGSLVVKARKEFIEPAGFEFDFDKGFDLTLDGDSVRIRDRQSSKLTLVSLKYVVEMVAASDAPADGRAVRLMKVKLSQLVRARPLAVVQSEPIEFDLNPASLSVQLVKLPAGEFAHATGNVVVYLKEGKVAYEDMGKLKISLHDVERKDVPAEPQDVSFEADELSGKVSDLKVIHYLDEPTLNKGQRRLSATWKLNLKGEAIEGRLKAAVDTATATLDAAERVELQADIGSDAAARAKAKADLAKAKADKTAAETKYKTSLSGERGKLAKLLTCGDIRLVTSKGVRSATNGKAATDLCKGLEKANDVEVTLTYSLDRYELPIALSYSLGKTPSFSPIASARLSKLDPR